MDYYTVISSDIYRLSCVAVSQLEGIDSSELKEEDILLVSEKINSDDPGLSTRTGYMSKFVSVEKLKETLSRLLDYERVSSDVFNISSIYAKKKDLKTGNLSVENLPNPYIISSMVFENGVPLSIFGYRLLDILKDTIICVDYESLSVNNFYAKNISSDGIDVGTIKNNFIQRLEEIVPNEASEENKLVDSSSMMSTIVRYSPTFRGLFENWDAVKQLTNYNMDEFGKREPDKNDYMVLSVASTYPYFNQESGRLENTWRFRYVGTWNDETGDRGWEPEYQVNIPPFTQKQWEAINSEINIGTKVWHEQDQRVGGETTPVYINTNGQVIAGKNYLDNIPTANENRVGGFKLYGDGYIGQNNFPVILDKTDTTDRGKAYVHIPGATLSGGAGIEIDKEEGLIRVDPDNIETWTFTLRNDNGTTETITKRFVVVNESCVIQVYVGEGQGQVSAIPGGMETTIQYGEQIEVSAFPDFGQKFLGWKSNQDQEQFESTNSNYSFRSVHDTSLFGYFGEYPDNPMTQVRFVDQSFNSYNFSNNCQYTDFEGQGIRPQAFQPGPADWNDYKIETVNFGTEVTAIGESLAVNCPTLAHVELPSTILAINNGAFLNCQNISNVVIPDDSQLTSIGNFAFQYCIQLSSINIPDGVKKLSKREFYNCTSLTSAIENTHLSAIGLSSFYGCGFTDISVVGDIERIGQGSFSKCNRLSSVYIGTQLKQIGEYAFQDCTNLEKVTLPDSGITLPDQNLGIFSGVKNDCKFYIYRTDPEETRDDTQTYLSTYENIQQSNIYRIEVTSEPEP